MSDFHHLSLVEQLAGLRRGDFSSVELTTHYLERISRLDASLGAFITVTPDLAMAEARQADIVRRRTRSGDVPPLLGVPIGIKDLHATAGVRTTAGSAALAEAVPDADGWTVGLLRRAGMVLVGKTNVPEFGLTCYTENDVICRPAVTPYDVVRYASGSSGGAAAAVAGGLLPAAHGSDGAGSIRTPAAVCHLVGVKPSRGLISAWPASALISTGTEGPLSRTTADAAALLDVMTHPPAGDLYRWRLHRRCVHRPPSTSRRDVERYRAVRSHAQRRSRHPPSTRLPSCGLRLVIRCMSSRPRRAATALSAKPCTSGTPESSRQG